MTRYITLNTTLHNSDRNYPTYTYGRICVEDGNPTCQVYNTEKDAIVVNSFNIDVQGHFEEEYRYGRVYINPDNKRAYIHLIYKEPKGNSRYTGTLFSRYLYLAHHKEIPENYDVDHIDGNKFNDKINNLIAIHHEHNFLKSNYGYHWLPEYNKVHNTFYTEQDLLDRVLLDKVIAYVDTVRNDRYLEMGRKYYRENADKLNEAGKVYREKNIDRIRQRDRDYHQANKEQRNSKQKEYWAKNADRFKLINKEYRRVNKEALAIKAKEYRLNNLEKIRITAKLNREKNAETIKRKKSLANKLDLLLKKKWTVEIGKKIIEVIEETIKDYNVTIKDITSGLDITKFNGRSVSLLQKLSLLYSENYHRLNDD